MSGTVTQFFVPGGTLKPTAEAYVERAADSEFYRALNAGEFCFVLTSRQMGKSSLMARTAARLRSDGSATAVVDLTSITDAVNPDAKFWYRGVCRRIAQDVGLMSDFDRWWKPHEDLTQVQRFCEFLETFVLGQLGAQRVIIFVDEIDVTLRLDFTDDFFAAIRACYNARATNSQFERLTFALLGVASPSDLIKDSSRTPFNVGQRIDLDDFTLEEALKLTAGFDCDETTSRRILSRILYWTGGQPYLTQRVCLEVAEHANTVANGEVVSWDTEVDNIVHNLFCSPEASRAEVHFKYIRDRLRVDPRLPAILREYRGILEGRSIRDAPQSLIHTALKLAGLVKVDREGHLRIRNRIYECVFDKTWTNQVMPANWTRRVAVVSSALLLVLLVAVALAVPALTSALSKAQMTGTMNNARQLYLAQFMMSNDGAATGDPLLAWPGDLPTLPTTITEYLNVLVGKGYLKGADAIKLLSAPGASYTATVTTSGGVDTLSAASGTPALKIWLVQDSNPATTIFATSANYTYNTALSAAARPYGSRGFITIKKGGDASIYRVGQAQDTGWPNGTSFQNSVGFKPTDSVGTPTNGDPTTPGVGVLTLP
jgi:hypothetical protein